MKVILRQDVRGLGTAGSVVEVSDGYARNYLVPRGLAEAATPERLREVAARREQDAARARRAREEAERLAARLEGAVVVVPARVGAAGKLFGSVQAQDVAEALARDAGARVDRRQVELPEQVKSLGQHPALLRLHPGVTARITVKVVPRE